MSNKIRKSWLTNLPHLFELDRLKEFCAKYTHVFIYGRGPEQEYLLKLLDMSDISIEGYVVSDLNRCKGEFIYRNMPVQTVEDVLKMQDTGIILGLPDRYHGDVVSIFQNSGFDAWMSLSEFSRFGIAEQMEPRDKDSISFEVCIVDHCNLSCQMCDHFSQLADKWFVDIQTYTRDIERMAELFEHKTGTITLVGGEPTLHPELAQMLIIGRKLFPDTRINLLTNGILLPKMENDINGNIWKVCSEQKIDMTITAYPINFDYIGLENKAREYGISLRMASNIHDIKTGLTHKISDRHPLNLDGKVPPIYAAHCFYFNKCHILREGKYYMCPMAAHIGIFNKYFDKQVPRSEKDYLNIYEVQSWKDFAEFGSAFIPMCRYCDQKRWGHAYEWKPSNKTIDEYI